MSDMKKVLTLVACGCICLMVGTSASADFVDVNSMNKEDPATQDLCIDGNGPEVPGPLTVCNLYAIFDLPADRLLSIGDSDLQVFNDGVPDVFFQHLAGTDLSPTEFIVGIFPDVICDSFVATGWKFNIGGNTDKVQTDADFSGDDFNNIGHISGGWFNADPPNGQGDAGTDPPNQNMQVLFLQSSVAQGLSMSGFTTIFWLASNGDVVGEVAFEIECPAVAGKCMGNDECEDENPCTDNICDDDGICQFPPNDANSCDDGAFCNGAETCNGGVCDAGVDPCAGGGECNAECNEGAESCFDKAGTNCGDPATECSGQDTCDGAGTCLDNDDPDETACDDDVFCNGADTCLNGECVDHAGDPCAGGAACNAACNEGTDDCFDAEDTPCGDGATSCSGQDTCDGAGNCQDNDEPDETPCEDDVFCNGADACLDGECADHAGDPCAGGAECNATCNENEDNCLDPNGTPCSEGGTCQDGVCVPPAECQPGDKCGDGNPCTDDACENNVCVHEPNDANLCDDGAFCNGAETCNAGSCDSAGDPCAGGAACNATCNEAADNCFDTEGTFCGEEATPCSGQDTCDGAGSCLDNDEPDETACDDDVFCNGADACLNGECADHAGDPCAGGAECNATCNENDENCLDPNGTPCSEGGTCQDGVCVPGDCPGGCDDENPCTDDACVGGVCEHENVKNGTACPDGLFCNGEETCTDGSCGTGTGDPCEGGGACNTTCNETEENCYDAEGTPCGNGATQCSGQDTCDGAGACQDNDEQDDTPCDDGQACNVGETCQSGSCDGGDPQDCTDAGDQCNDASCGDGGPEGNCDDLTPVKNGVMCDDGNACTENDVCVDGVCAGTGECDELELPLDIMPRMCPNTVMRGTNAAVWAALLGSEDFDITQVRMSSLLLSRADGEGDSLVPKNLKFKDEGTPFGGDLCDCNAAGRDQITDLRMKFKTDAMLEAFLLDDEESGDTVELIVTGQLNDGTLIIGRDCILLVR